MKNQLKTIDSLIGKTIDKVILDNDDLWIRFSNNEFTVLTVKDQTEGFGHSKSCIDIDEWSKDETESNLVKLGIITSNDHQKALEKEEEEYRNRKALEKQKFEEDLKKSELEHLNYLKSKYE